MACTMSRYVRAVRWLANTTGGQCGPANVVFFSYPTNIFKLELYTEGGRLWLAVTYKGGLKCLTSLGVWKTGLGVWKAGKFTVNRDVRNDQIKTVCAIYDLIQLNKDIP